MFVNYFWWYLLFLCNDNLGIWSCLIFNWKISKRNVNWISNYVELVLFLDWYFLLRIGILISISYLWRIERFRKGRCCFYLSRWISNVGRFVIKIIVLVWIFELGSWCFLFIDGVCLIRNLGIYLYVLFWVWWYYGIY